ncbi:MAG: response regulator [Planctomycetes bacterium]|nr:response regulator [Planctomycetota bacterium]
MAAPLVLIADNDRAVSDLLVEVLARRGLRTVCAYDGMQAAELARDPDVAVLVCDLDMPKQNGIAVLEGLAPTSRPPSVVVSGFLDERAQVRLAALGIVQAVLKKPFDLFEFAAIVQRLATDAGSAEAEAEQTA